MFEPLTPTKWAALGVIAVLLAALIFLAGVGVGSHRMVMGPQEGRPPFSVFGIPLPHGYIVHGHGAVGIIASVSTSSVTLTEREGDTEIVSISPGTTIESPDGTTTMTTLAPGMHVIVIGAPDEAQERINASLIRIVPEPPQP